jgi:hydrogenase maturation protease
VVIEDDPGRDLGMLRQPGHRFFFDAEEIEALPPDESRTKSAPKQARILIAGIGNIFLGDDGFGVEVARRLIERGLPSVATGEVKIVDFGIRGFDLVYAFQDGYETTILVDAYPHGQPAGTVSLIEPDLSKLNEAEPALVETHGMDPMQVLRMASAMNVNLKKILLVGCEPATFGGEEGKMELSETVEAAIDEAVNLIGSVVEKILSEPR